MRFAKPKPCVILSTAMGFLSDLFANPLSLLIGAIPLIYSVVIHEVAHGWVALKMGDSTAKWMGRLTLNPLKHLDPLGTVALFIVGFGWARPVPINPNNFRDFRKGLIYVSSAGIVANILLVILAELTIEVFRVSVFSVTYDVLVRLENVNLMLAAFNLIPIPPLDGSKILMGFASRRFQYTLAQIEPYGMFIILGLLFLGVLNPLIIIFRGIIVYVIRLALGF